MNINITVKNLRGKEMPKTFPEREEVEALPKLPNGQPDIDKLPKETVGNIIMNCLSNYVQKDKKDGWYISLIAQSIISNENGKIDLKDKLNQFLIELLEDQIMKREIDDKGKEETKGLYASWAIVQDLEELGVKKDI